MDVNLESLLKVWGPLGLFVGVLLLLIWKVLIPYIKQQQVDNRETLTSALEDARKERDLMRQLREKEVDKFLESLKYRDEQFKSVAEAISGKRQTRR